MSELVREGEPAGRLHRTSDVHGHEAGSSGTTGGPEHTGIAEPVPQHEDVELVLEQPGETSQRTGAC